MRVKTKILVTDCAGFIAARVCELLLESGESVFGIDNMNDYYDVRLKSWRLKQLKKYRNFEFKKIDIEDSRKLTAIFVENKFSSLINLAARARN
jgi:nucleoside-diphosphate-sugar epimerase